MAQEPEQENLVAEVFQQFSEQFDTLCQQRHEVGAKEYGQFTFLENDVVRMMAEELADTANYCRMQFIKLMILQDMLAEVVAKSGLDPAVELSQFKGVGEVGWHKA